MNKTKILLAATALMAGIGATALASTGFPPMPPGHPDQADMTIVNHLQKPLSVVVTNSLGKLENDPVAPHASQSHEDKGYVPYGGPAQLNATIGDAQDPAGQCQAVSKPDKSSNTKSTVFITKQADGSQGFVCQAQGTTVVVFSTQ
ncbi:MAG: hypothetical protein CMF39_05955 [Legionellaceae bacterium]|nr:hypothetical protein [Legionellaceae bacterium]|tara:strand:+ start:812 stop:1249 length:438 start_codon:yes stop_codon:yes gene_type:complete